MNRYIGQVVQDGTWLAFGIEAETIYEANDYVHTIPTEGGRSTSIMLTTDEVKSLHQDERDRY